MKIKERLRPLAIITAICLMATQIPPNTFANDLSWETGQESNYYTKTGEKTKQLTHILTQEDATAIGPYDKVVIEWLGEDSFNATSMTYTKRDINETLTQEQIDAGLDTWDSATVLVAGKQYQINLGAPVSDPLTIQGTVAGEGTVEGYQGFLIKYFNGLTEVRAYKPALFNFREPSVDDLPVLQPTNYTTFEQDNLQSVYTGDFVIDLTPYSEFNGLNYTIGVVGKGESVTISPQGATPQTLTTNVGTFIPPSASNIAVGYVVSNTNKQLGDRNLELKVYDGQNRLLMQRLIKLYTVTESVVIPVPDPIEDITATTSKKIVKHTDTNVTLNSIAINGLFADKTYRAEVTSSSSDIVIASNTRNITGKTADIISDIVMTSAKSSASGTYKADLKIYKDSVLIKTIPFDVVTVENSSTTKTDEGSIDFTTSDTIAKNKEIEVRIKVNTPTPIKTGKVEIKMENAEFVKELTGKDYSKYDDDEIDVSGKDEKFEVSINSDAKEDETYYKTILIEVTGDIGDEVIFEVTKNSINIEEDDEITLGKIKSSLSVDVTKGNVSEMKEESKLEGAILNIKEISAGSMAEGNYKIDFDGFTIKSADIAIETGNITIKPSVSFGNRMEFTVTDESTKASTIKISNIVLNMSNISIKPTEIKFKILSTTNGKDTELDRGVIATIGGSTQPITQPIGQNPVITNPANANKLVLQIGSPVMFKGANMVAMDAQPYIKNSRTMIPLSFIANNMGAQVSWNDASKTATITKGSNTAKISLSSKNVEATKSGVGNNISMDVYPEIVNNRMFLPIAYVGQILDISINWNDSDRTITVVP